MSDKEILEQEREAFQNAYDAEAENRERGLESIEFARLGKQWPEEIVKARKAEGRPILTINKQPANIRQVVNDCRMNRPQIKVKGVDDHADAATAAVIEGTVRNIEYTSKADTAYDTAVDNAATMGWGYLRVAIDYIYDDSFDKALCIKRVVNPFSVYGDPNSTEGDSSDWMQGHVVDYMSKKEFNRKYKGASEADWDAHDYSKLDGAWQTEDGVMVCEAWSREIVKRTILQLSDKRIVGEKEFMQERDSFDASGVTVINSRKTDSFKVTQRIMTGAEVLETNEWAGRYIPIIPVYGEEVWHEGKRMLFGLTHHAQDAQRMFNYWRSNATELVALAPRVPYIGEEGAFSVDEGWITANTSSHAYLQYKRGSTPPQRQQLDSGPAIGSMSEAMAASDDMKSIIGLHDASLGQRSNETSGVAINARKKEGDVSTFHFIDNLSRGIRHTGCVLVDLIPKVYTSGQIIRILGEDGKERTVKLGQNNPKQMPAQPIEGQTPEDKARQEASRIYDLGLGRYDVAVSSGPGFTTRREEMAAQMTDFLKAFPQAAPFVGDLMAKAMDWSDEIVDRLKSMMPQQAQGGMPPELQQMIEQGKQQITQLSEQVEKLEADLQMAKIEGKGKDVESQSLRAELHLKGVMDTQRKQMASMQQSMEPQAPAPQQSPVSVNVPENIGEAVANAVVPAISQAITQAISQIPPLQVQMPAQRLKRKIPVRDQSGLITETREEFIPEEMVN